MKHDLGSFARRSAFATVLAMFLSISHSLAQSPSQSKSDSGDLILINGKIITVDEKDSIVQALAIHNGKIVATGTDEEIRKFARKDARVIDLHGRTATPGLIDAHCHFDETPAIYGIELSKISRISEAVALVRQKVATRQPGEWVTGAG
jgi:predicted amidohydrolase YtcJ